MFEQRVGATGRASVDSVYSVDPDKHCLLRLGNDELGEEATDRKPVFALYARVAFERVAVVPPRLVQTAASQPAVLVSDQAHSRAVDPLKSQQIVESQQFPSPKSVLDP